MNRRTWKYKKAIGIGLSLVLFLGGIGIVQRILDNQTDNFKDETVVKVEEKKDEEKEDKKTIETLKGWNRDCKILL